VLKAIRRKETGRLTKTQKASLEGGKEGKGDYYKYGIV